VAYVSTNGVRDRWVLAMPLVGAITTAHFLSPSGFLGESTYLLMTGGAAAVAIAGAMRQPESRRLPWACVAAALTLSAVGDGMSMLLGLLDGTTPQKSGADALWLASYLALAIGISSVRADGQTPRRLDVDGLIDIGSFAVLAALVVTQFTVVRDMMNDSSFSMFARVTWTAYPVLDAALLGVVVQALAGRRLRGIGAAFVTCGAALWLISDFSSVMVSDAVDTTRWLDIGWMLGAASLAASAWPRHHDQSYEPAFTATRVSNRRILVTVLPLLMPGVIEVSEYARGHETNPIPLFGATLALVLLAFGRASRLVKARNREEEALERSTRYYAALAANSSDAVIVVDAQGRILNNAPNLAAMLGRRGTSTHGLDAVALLSPNDPDNTRAVFDRWWSTTGVVADSEVQATKADGSPCWFGVRAANLTNDPDVAGLVINLRDITDRKRAENELSHSAFHDALTGLANRALFHDRLEHALDRTARTGLGVAVVYLDLDGFKLVNDSRGHEVGDRVLREVATRLTSIVRSPDTVSRLGGDEFAILIEDSTRALDEAETVAARVLQSLTEPFILGAQRVVLSASIGITIGDVACTASSMIRDADMAMYRAKTTGKARWALYEAAMGTAALERLVLESDLREAVDNAQLRLVYQPIMELHTGTVFGFEALLRWDHPTRGTIGPEAFIHIAELNGSIVEIGQWVLEEACRTAAEWQRTYPQAHLSMSLNLSALQIAMPSIVDHVAAALEDAGLAPASLIVEMTESVLVEDAETAGHRLEELRALGIRLAIDDFGTGYSSLGYLRKFPFDILKVDRSFTSTITDRAQVPAIVRGLLDLAKTLNMKTVAEGIELDAQRESLRAQGCDFGQGFLFAKPLRREQAEAFLARALAGGSAAIETLKPPSKAAC
jgi:diguanylate cyclase (GGDEF)-like protein/PAS domain S-box-containing protein